MKLPENPTFMDLAMVGYFSCPDEAIHDHIDNWHADPLCKETLHDYLGMTREEYSSWVECKKTVKDIVEDRKNEHAR